MPSDAKKKRDAKKKEAAKLRNQPKSQKPVVNGDAENSETPEAACNGVDEGKEVVLNGALPPGLEEDEEVEEAIRQLRLVEIENANARSCTGVLVSHPRSRDLKIHQFNLTFHGFELIRDSKIEVSYGNRYGLVGLNGCGKSSLFQAIANREVPVPEQLDIFLLSREVPGTSQTALQAVMEADEVKRHLEKEAEELAHMADDDEAHERLMDIFDRLEEMNADTAEMRAAEILHNLGFTKEMQQKRCKDFSGGWRMRIALARALYLQPSVLLLDEPTNHLDLNACVWLEEELKTYKRVLVVISHSQDFMNSVCTDIIHLNKQQLVYYGGNYDTFVRTRLELLENQAKRFQWEQAQIAHMKNYIARFGHGTAKMARQAQSREKQLKRMVDGGLTEKVSDEKVKDFYFIDPGYIPPPVIMVQNVSFRYNAETPYIYRNLDFGIDLDTRLALVGPNGAGKSTLLKLIAGEIEPSEGLIRRHSHVKMGRYHQHLHEQLDLKDSALEHMQKCFPDITDKEQFRKIVGRYGITGRQQTCPMKQLSDGQRCRVSFAWLAWQRPHMLMLDEPTNHLDMETIDVLADALNEFTGGMLLVSHDFRLISQVADVIWICEKEKVTKFEGDIFAYKELLRKKIERQRRKAAAQSNVRK